MKLIVSILLVWCGMTGLTQSVIQSDSMPEYSSAPVAVYTKDYMRQYNMLKRTIVKVYPYALYAADILDQITNNVAAIEKRRKQNQYLKDSYQNLKDEFKYVFYELYTSEGIMLMKLVHRETGLTVYQIAEAYRGKKNAEIFEMMGKLWDQDIKIQFDPLGTDKIAEHVIRDIQSGVVPFNNEVIILDKQEYKVEQQKDRERKEQYKEREKAKKQQEREKKRALQKTDKE
ncbi:MAG: DUF4294 domain-containing protein [Bacteroidetes bacterium]|nr:DUF4294 domain-containing protein [Bacteroidota bacterium]